MRRSPAQNLAPSLLLAALALATLPLAAAQSGSTGVGPVDGAVATVEYAVNQTLNSTSPPSGNTTSPPGNSTGTPGGGAGSNSTSGGTGGSGGPGGNGTGGGSTGPGGTGGSAGNGTQESGTGSAGNGTSAGGGNATAGGSGNATAGGAGNSTAGNATGNQSGGNATTQADASLEGNGTATVDASPDVQTDASDAAGDDGPVALDPVQEDLALDGTGSDGDSGQSEAAHPCLGVSCDRSRVLAPKRVGGFPWLPLLITLLLAPLVGLLVARQAIRRWDLGKKARPAKAARTGPKNPPDALDPMKRFLKDVQEWKAIPQPGSEPAVPGGADGTAPA